MRHLNLLPAKRGVKAKSNSSLAGATFRVLTSAGEYAKALTLDQQDDLFYYLAEHLISEKLLVLATKALTYVANKETSIARFNYNTAAIAYWMQDYPQVITLLTKMLEFEPKHEAGWLLRGHAHFYLSMGYDAEECYLQAIRNKPNLQRRTHLHAELTRSAGVSATQLPSMDYSLHIRLGQIYLKRRAWKDAKIVYGRCCDEAVYTLAWLGLGISCMNLEEFAEAQEAFDQAIILDPSNSDVWGDYALLALFLSDETPGRFNQVQHCLKQALVLGVKDSLLLARIALLLLEKFYEAGAEPYVQPKDVSLVQLCCRRLKELQIAEGRDPDEFLGQVKELLESLGGDWTSLGL
jgi:tetratricopeptide (TPR) repeat protein